MKQSEFLHRLEANYKNWEAMYWTAQSEIATLKAELAEANATLKALGYKS